MQIVLMFSLFSPIFIFYHRSLKLLPIKLDKFINFFIKKAYHEIGYKKDPFIFFLKIMFILQHCIWKIFSIMECCRLLCGIFYSTIQQQMKSWIIYFPHEFQLIVTTKRYQLTMIEKTLLFPSYYKKCWKNIL